MKNGKEKRNVYLILSYELDKDPKIPRMELVGSGRNMPTPCSEMSSASSPHWARRLLAPSPYKASVSWVL